MSLLKDNRYVATLSLKMSTNQELMGAEESLKNKYLDIFKAMTYLELKRFNKNHFKQMVFNVMMAVLPEHEKSQ